MTTEEFAEKFDLTVFNKGAVRKIESFYIGDLLSWVMGRADENSCWLTIMNNMNVCAVAKLADVACTVLCENVLPDDNLKEKAKQENLCLFGSKLSLFELAKEITKAVYDES